MWTLHGVRAKKLYNTDAVLDKLTERVINDWTDLLSTNIEYLSADTLKHQFKISYGLLAGSDDYAQTVNNSLGNSVNTNKTMDGHRHIIEAQYTLKRPKFVYTVGNQNYISKMNENVKSKNGSDFSMWETIMGLYMSGKIKFTQDLSLYLGGGRSMHIINI